MTIENSEHPAYRALGARKREFERRIREELRPHYNGTLRMKVVLPAKFPCRYEVHCAVPGQQIDEQPHYNRLVSAIGGAANSYKFGIDHNATKRRSDGGLCFVVKPDFGTFFHQPI